ncbi:MAG TPA: hypothetical protein VM050_04670 [Patescibacteria group bacterium]|nr:hypothetical protein [Patescibacteria group bacterium]
MFTAIIPMQLVMKQADVLYERGVQEFDRKGDERDLENIYMYAYPPTEESTQLKVVVDNVGSVGARVVRVWVKDTIYPVDSLISTGGSATLGPFNISVQENTSYPVKAVTDRGNIYSSRSGSLFYGDGIWYTASLGISVTVANDKGKFHIKVNNETWSAPEYWTTGMDFGDLMKFFEVAKPDTYAVTVQKSTGGGWVDLPGTPVLMEIRWPDGSPIVFVYTSGLDV